MHVFRLNDLLQVDTLVFRGAEAVIYSGKYLKEPVILKIRYPKKYRHPQLDFDLRFLRTKMEARILQRALAAGVNVPSILAILSKHSGLVLKFIEGVHLTNLLENPEQLSDNDQELWPRRLHNIYQEAGIQVGRLHACGIAHGDLTPHNMIINLNELKQVHIIDFGLASVTNDPEKFATDLFTFLKTMQTVAKGDPSYLFETFMKAYREEYTKWGKDYTNVRVQFDDLNKRGRYKVREKGFYEE